jgi:hypothetical protein
MKNTPVKIDKKINFEKEISFCTLVTRFDEYQEMVDSAINAGFNDEKIEFLYFDNLNDNFYDGFSGINRALLTAKGRYLVYCHQDVIFKYDGYKQLLEKLQELNALDENWAIAGNAGKDKNGNFAVMISDPNGERQRLGKFPNQVISLDENFMVINQEKIIGASCNLQGFHLYGIDLCQNAINLGMNCYVIDFHLYHKSAGTIDEKFYRSQKKYIEMLSKRKKNQFLATTCTNFFVTKNTLFNSILNSFIFLKVFCYCKRFLNKISNI